MKKIIYKNRTYDIYKDFNNNDEYILEDNLLSTILHDSNLERKSKKSIDDYYHEFVVSKKKTKKKDEE